MASSEHGDPGVAGLAGEMVGELGHLVGLHIQLAKAELATGVTTLARRLATSVALIVVGLVGYTILMAAAGLFLGRVLGWGTAAGLALVGLFNMVVGGAGAWAALHGSPAASLTGRSASELSRSVHTLSSIASDSTKDIHVA